MANFEIIICKKTFLSFLMIINICNLCLGDSESFTEKISVRAMLGKDEFVIGEPIVLNINIINGGPNTVRIGEAVWAHFDFNAVDDSNKPVERKEPPSQISILSAVYPLKSGEDYNDIVFINKLLNFKDEGKYTVTYSGAMRIYENRLENKRALNISGVIEFDLRYASGVELEMHMRKYLKMLKSKNELFVRRAAEAFTLSEPDISVKLLKETLDCNENDSPSYSAYSVWALATIGNSHAIQSLLDLAMYSKCMKVRKDVIREIGRFKVDEAIPTIIGLLNSTEPIIRCEALHAMARLCDDENYLPSIERMFDDPDEEVREAAENAYQEIVNKKER